MVNDNERRWMAVTTDDMNDDSDDKWQALSLISLDHILFCVCEETKKQIDLTIPNVLKNVVGR